MSRTRTSRIAAVTGSIALAATIGAATALGVASATPAAHHAVLTHHRPAASKTITAVETEYHIALSTTHVSAGTYTVKAENKGGEKHGLVVNGPGQKKTLVGYVEPGKTISKSLKLRKGNYDIYCPVTGHKMLGMNTHLKVS